MLALCLAAVHWGCSDTRYTNGSDGGAADDGGGADGEAGPYVRIVYPTEGIEAPNPVTFQFEAGGGVQTVAFHCEGWPLQNEPIPAGQSTHTYDFSGVNRLRTVTLTGYDAADATVAQDQVSFIPFEDVCAIPDQPGFNHYTVRAINDWGRFPKDGTYPYCWAYLGDTCGANWGQIHNGYYGGQLLFSGGGDCFCSGHTLEIFLWAYRLWLTDKGLNDTTLYTSSGHTLEVSSVDVGTFYQHWQGFGVATTASSANAFESASIGENLYEAHWDDVLPGDYVNLSRSTGSGHAVIFVNWIVDGGNKIGLRYYGCNTSGDSCPDPADPDNTQQNSGPSFKTEHFYGHGGTVLPEYLFIGRVYLPED